MKRLFAVHLILIAGLGGPWAATAVAQTAKAHPGFNLFTVQQDVDIGRQSAIEAERQLKLLNDPTVDRYVGRIVQRLAAHAPGATYPYQIKTVNAAEINAFALPGGPMYVNRGTVEAARSEAELAGVLAHEMSHVALRHGTHQASKAYLAQAGLGILGGLLGKSSTSIVNTIGGLGLNAVFLKFSRDDEYQADQTGAEIMAAAGYDPVAMANFFELLRAEQGRNPSKVEQFFSDHPPTADREARIRQMATTLGRGQTQLVGGFDGVRSRLHGLPATGPQQVVATGPGPQTTPAAGPLAVHIAAPSARFVRFAQPNGFFTIDHPDNWQAYPSGFAVSIAPDGGVVTASDGRQTMLYGVIVNHYTPFNSPDSVRRQSLQKNYAPFEDRNAARGTLENATDDLVTTILQSNSYLRPVDTAARPEVIDGARGFSLVLAGPSPVTGEEERVTVYTRALADGHVVYALGIGPGSDNGTLVQTFARMIRTLAINDAAAHRATQTNLRVANLGSSQRARRRRQQ